MGGVHRVVRHPLRAAERPRRPDRRHRRHRHHRPSSSTRCAPSTGSTGRCRPVPRPARRRRCTGDLGRSVQSHRPVTTLIAEARAVDAADRRRRPAPWRSSAAPRSASPRRTSARAGCATCCSPAAARRRRAVVLGRPVAPAAVLVQLAVVPGRRQRGVAQHRPARPSRSPCRPAPRSPSCWPRAWRHAARALHRHRPGQGRQPGPRARAPRPAQRRPAGADDGRPARRRAARRARSSPRPCSPATGSAG